MVIPNPLAPSASGVRDLLFAFRSGGLQFTLLALSQSEGSLEGLALLSPRHLSAVEMAWETDTR